MIAWPSLGGQRIRLVLAGVLVLCIALADWSVAADVPLGFLYLLPIVLASSVLGRKQIALLAAGCTFLAELFDSFPWSPLSGIPRDVLYFAAFAGIGLFAQEVSASRRVTAEHMRKLEIENRARHDAEEQLQVLVESSPIAIVTMDAAGTVLLANDAAHRLLAAPPGALRGGSIQTYLPALVNVPALREGQQSFRTVMQCRGHRLDGDIFIADVWFSTYRTSAGPRLSAMIVDASEELRDREESGLHQLLLGSRILVGAVSHEIRNVCGAIAVVYENLSRTGILAGNRDFDALGTLVLAMEKIAGMELRQNINQVAALDLESFLEELRIVVSPALRENDIELVWDIQPDLPAVWADRHSLMQVFLNLVSNSERAMADQAVRRLTLAARSHPNRVTIFVSDTGPGVASPEMLFKPFQPQAQATGIGLYLSRALMRSFRGDLRYEPDGEGATFVVELSPRAGELQEEHEA